MDHLQVTLSIQRENTPLCVETPTPEFSWYLSAQSRCVKQEAYRLQVLSTTGESVWDTGDEKSCSNRCSYAGPALMPETAYIVRLTITDNRGTTATTESLFRTGLMDTDPESPRWQGAKWIGTGTRSLWAPALSVFQLSCQITLEEGAEKAGLLFGGNDPRLMDRDKNILGVEARRFGSYIWVRLNTSPLKEKENAQLEIFRVGYTKEDSREVPLFSLPIPETVLNPENRHSPHTILIKSNYGQIQVFLDGTELRNKSERPGPFDDGSINLNPMGRGGDFVCFPNLCDIGAKVEAGQKARFRDLTVKNYRRPESVLAKVWEEEITLDGDERGGFRLFDPSCHGLPLLRREFSATKPQRAWLTITARGIYEAYINGKKVGEDYFAPGLTQYDKTHMYQVYDVTDLLRSGENALGIELSEGWWSGAISFRGENWNFWGDCQSVRAKLTMEGPDGRIETIITNEYFEATDDGPDRYGSFFQGQVYDAIYEEHVRGWLEPGFKGNWPAAREIPLSEETVLLGEYAAGLGPHTGSSNMSYDGLKLMGQIGNGVKCVEVLPALSMEEVRPGVYVYDFGQNIAGIPEIILPGGAPGQEVTLRYGEILYPNLPEYGENQGMLMTENLRGAWVTDIVYLGEEPITFCPHFTFHGFRYLEVTGVEAPPELNKVKALALSSVEHLTADYRCSDEGVNQLFRNICWSLRDNFLSVPTDCPQRNERMGWSGDLSVFSRTAVYLCDADAFLRRHLMAMRDLQAQDGMFPDIAPVASGFGGILWGSAGMTVPWEMYLQYGDEAILREHYEAMEKYIAYLLRNVDDTGLQTAGALGDWLGPQKDQIDNKLLWMAYFVYDLYIMSKTAEILEKPQADDYFALYAMTRHRLNQVFFDPESHKTVYSSKEAAKNEGGFGPPGPKKPLPPQEPGGGYRMDTQTSYCVPLALELVDETHKQEAGVHLAHVCGTESRDDDGILRPPYSLMTGFIGTAWILPALTLAGRDDIAYRMLMNHQYPSWLYPVDQGATTIWERLDSYTLDRGFGGHNSMNSFNHYSFGAVGQWLLSRSLGIAREQPGFQRFTLCPMPDEGREMTWAEGWCLTPAGKIESCWEQFPRGVRYTVTVPANTGCLLQLPGNPFSAVTESGLSPAEAEGVAPLGHNGTAHQFWLESGTYVFDVIR